MRYETIAGIFDVSDEEDLIQFDTFNVTLRIFTSSRKNCNSKICQLKLNSNIINKPMATIRATNQNKEY